MFLSITLSNTNSIKKYLDDILKGQSHTNQVYLTATIEFLVTDEALTRQWSDLGPIIKNQVVGFRQNILFHDSWRIFKSQDKVLSTNSMFTY